MTAANAPRKRSGASGPKAWKAETIMSAGLSDAGRKPAAVVLAAISWELSSLPVKAATRLPSPEIAESTMSSPLLTPKAHRPWILTARLRPRWGLADNIFRAISRFGEAERNRMATTEPTPLYYRIGHILQQHSLVKRSKTDGAN